MAKKRIMLFAVLLSAIMLMAAFVSSINPAYARYENAFSCKTVLEPQEGGIKSNFLGAGGTVKLLGELDRIKTVSFVLVSEDAIASGNFRWSVERGCEDYLSVSAGIDATEIVNGGSVNLEKGKEHKITVTFTPGNAPAQDTEADVTFAFGNAMGVFTVMIPAEEAESGQTVSETEQTGTEGTETEENGNETELEQGGATAGDESESTNSADASLKIATIALFDAEYPLPIKITSSGVSSVKLGISGAKNPVFIYEEQKYLPFDDEEAVFEIAEGETTVFADLSYGETDENITVTAKAGSITETAEASPGAEKQCSARIYSSSELEIASVDSTEETSEETEEETASSEGWETVILGKGDSLALTFPEEWEMKSFSVERFTKLSKDEDGNNVYGDPAYEPEEGFAVTKESGRIILGAGENLPPAGTYRITFTWECEGIQFETKTAFFINYTTASESANW